MFSRRYGEQQALIGQTIGLGGVVSGPTTGIQMQYLGGTDEQRAADLMTAVTNTSIGMFISNRGGYGVTRLLRLVDFAAVAASRRGLMGYSDLTALLNAVHTKTGLVTFHGPMGTSNWSKDSFNAVYARRVLAGELVTFANPASFSPAAVTVQRGKAKGRLIGGNLSVFVSLLGTPYLPSSFEGYIVFLEDVGELPYRVDRMLQQVVNAGVFKEAAGFVWGTCAGCEADCVGTPANPASASTVATVVTDKLAQINRPAMPALMNFMFGHIPQQFTLPVGGLVELDADAQQLRMLESAVAAP